MSGHQCIQQHKIDTVEYVEYGFLKGTGVSLCWYSAIPDQYLFQEQHLLPYLCIAALCTALQCSLTEIGPRDGSWNHIRGARTRFEKLEWDKKNTSLEKNYFKIRSTTQTLYFRMRSTALLWKLYTL